MLRIGKRLGAGSVLAVFACGHALADPAPDYSANMFGDLGGLRQAFAKVGVTISATETGEVFANPFGGLQPGVGYDGLTTITVQIDTKTAFHIDGGTINASVLNLHGGNFNASNIGALQTLSGIQGDRATRLWELWWDQKFGENFDVRFGQQSLDVEFAVAQSSALFVNSLFGWPALHALDMPQGGPAYPLASLGVRGRWQSGAWTAQGGVYSGAPAPFTNPNPQAANPYGLSFPLNGALFVAEGQYAVGEGEGELPGVYKIGGWYDNLSFANLQFNAFGQPLADPAAAQTPLTYRGDFGFYAVADQTIWRGAEKERTLSFFIRPQFAPQGDRNLASFAINAGLTLKDPLPGRPNDSFGVGFGFVQLSNSAIGASADAAVFNPGVFSPKLSNETVFEATYQYQATSWAQIQPDLQYIHNVGGGIANPLAPDSKVGDALVAGLRVNLSF